MNTTEWLNREPEDTELQNTSPSSLTLFIASLNIIIICIGVVGNLTSFLIFRLNHSFKWMSSMVFLSFVAITDTIALFEWNLGHFFMLAFQIDLQLVTGCRASLFTQYSSLQSSGLLLSAMCIDRYVTVMAVPGSFLGRLPFRTVRNAFVWSIAIVTFCILFNFHHLITAGYYEISTSSNGSNISTLSCEKFSSGIDLAVWDQVNFVMYCLLPFFVMITFNGLLIVNLRSKLASNLSPSTSKKLNLTLSLIAIGFVFLIMTAPGTVMFSFFYDGLFSKLDERVVFLIDDISFLNHASLFFISFLTIRKFRRTIIQVVKKLFKRKTKLSKA